MRASDFIVPESLTIDDVLPHDVVKDQQGNEYTVLDINYATRIAKLKAMDTGARILKSIKDLAMVKQSFASIFDEQLSEAFGLTYRGYPCTQDCQGHRAGHHWAVAMGIKNPAHCPPGTSNSFHQGCKSANDYRKKLTKKKTSKKSTPTPTDQGDKSSPYSGHPAMKLGK